MTQGVLLFKYEEEKTESGATALAGLPVYLDLAKVLGLSESIQKHLTIRENSQGWTDVQAVMSLILLNLAGGSCVDDLDILNADQGFCKILSRIQSHSLKRKERRKLEQRWRKEKKRFVPSPLAMFRYLSRFHDPDQEKSRQSGKAFIPAPNKYLTGLVKTNKDLCSFFNTASVCKIATLDMDATLVETAKENAFYCYKGFKSYQPLNTWWAQQNVILHTQFRDGNVPAGYEQLKVFKQALRCLPKNVEQVNLRSDTAGYQHDLLHYCETGQNKRFGRIEFAIGCKVSSSFKTAVAQVRDSDRQPVYKTIGSKRIETGTQWAEVCFVPNEIGHSKKGPEYRYLAKRQLMSDQQVLPGMQKEQMSLPFPTMNLEDKQYKVLGIVTNISESKMNGEDIIHWLHQRCGKSEQVHSVIKKDLAGGTLPSNDFGKNAAWWWIMIIALNLNAIMKSLALEPEMKDKRMKAIRFSIINLPGRVIKKSRQLILRLSKGHPSFKMLIDARKRIAMLQTIPSG